MNTLFSRRPIRFLLWIGGLVATSFCVSADAQQRTAPKTSNPTARLAPTPDSASQDFGHVAVLVDNGLMVTERNLFDLNGVTLRFEPAGDGRYTLTRSTAVLDSEFGPALTFGYPGVTDYPGDDDSQEVAFPGKFPFYGATYPSVFVNTDGNVTLGEAEFSSDARDKARHTLGPPRISAFLNDWWPQNALNPNGQGSIHAAAKTAPNRLVVTWNGVRDYDHGGTSTFQMVLYASGVIEIVFANLDPIVVNGVTGIAPGAGQGTLQVVDFATPSSPRTFDPGTVLEAFSQYAQVSIVQVSREFYKTHPDKFDYLVTLTDFSTNDLLYSHYVSNHTHGIGTPLAPNGAPFFPSTEYDFTAAHGSAGELEQIVFMNNINIFPSDSSKLVNPSIEPYRSTTNINLQFEEFGGPVSLDGQVMNQVRIAGTLPEDDGEFSRYFAHGGAYSLGLFYPFGILAQEVGHRWGAYVRFVHPTKGVGFDSYDLLGRSAEHWSYFFNSATPASQFGNPRSSAMEGNILLDLGAPASYNGAPIALVPGERLFKTPETELMDGYNTLDQYLMGLRRAPDVGPFFYVDEPRSIYNGQSLDGFPPGDTSATMRGWAPMGGIAFAGKRVDLTIKNIQDYEALREGKVNPSGHRFWGPKGNLAVRYFSDSRRVDPNGDAKVVLSEADRELGDEADLIDQNGKPVDVKTMAFILVVKNGQPGDHGTSISRVDVLRQAWQSFANGPAAGGRGRFDTTLSPSIY